MEASITERPCNVGCLLTMKFVTGTAAGELSFWLAESSMISAVLEASVGIQTLQEE